MMDSGDAILAMAASITERAHDLIRDGWTKGSFYKKVDGAPVEFCILGALDLALEEMFPAHDPGRYDISGIAQMFILQEAEAQFKHKDRCIPAFNDAAERQLEDVLSVLRAAGERMWDISVQREDVGGTVDLRSFATHDVEEETGRRFLNARLVSA